MNAKHTPGPWEQGNGYGCGNERVYDSVADPSAHLGSESSEVAKSIRMWAERI